MDTWLIVLISVVATYAVLTIIRVLTAHEKQVQHQIEHRYGVEDPQFARSIEGLLPPALVSGNRVAALLNGDEIFPAMLEAIRSAKQTITFETFIYWSGEIGSEFAAALTERARAGVKVHVLLDWLGSNKMDASVLEAMERDGIEVQRYHPLRWYQMSQLNNRTHRKLLVVDGQVAFTGGVGIADQWTGSAQDEEHWRDSHFRVEGPVVAQVQAAFMDNWLKTKGRVLHGPEYYPVLENAGPTPAQMFMSSPKEGSESARLMYLFSMTCAARSIRIANAYFIPDDLSIQTLIAARKRGVRVEIIVPGKKTDVPLVRRASRARWGPLLEAGVRIYEYQPTMYHCKVMIIDECWVSVGSTNFDNRSFRLNDEANLNLLDTDFAQGQVEVFEQDRGNAREITHAQWLRRPLREKIKERGASLLRTQL
ncbi:MAG: cardiolipin synthase B [Burkholderiales bacterium]|nr:cardiolipin synthase B [Phycisphaerae bacterium]